MRRSRYLVAYDIRDPKRLREVHRVVRGFGSRLQYSVYVCDMTEAELCELRFDLRSTMATSVDSVVIVPLGDGYDQSVIEFMGARDALPKAGPRII